MQKLFSDYRKHFNIALYAIGFPLAFIVGILGGVVFPDMNWFYRFLLLFIIIYPILMGFVFYFYKKTLRRITNSLEILHNKCDNKTLFHITNRMMEEKPPEKTYSVIAAGYRVNALKNSNLELARSAISEFKQQEIYATYSNQYYYANFLIESCYVALLEHDEEEFDRSYDALRQATDFKPLKKNFLLQVEVNRLNHEIAILTSVKQDMIDSEPFDKTLATTPYHRALLAKILNDASLYKANEPYGNCWFSEQNNIVSK